MPTINLSSSVETDKGSKRICIPCDKDQYDEMLYDRFEFRKILDSLYKKRPELFPEAMSEGYVFDGFQTESVKLGIKLRRIRIKGDVFIIHPSFVLPYMMGFADEVEKPLFLRRFGVPYWAITYVFGRNDMYWYRLEIGFARNSIVGTTVRKPETLPKDIVSDEKHTKLNGKKVYIATTAGKECVLGAAIAPGAGEGELTDAYEVFREEARNVDAEYKPDSVNTDGWEATRKSWKNLFPGITVILCFFHAFLSIKRRCVKKFGELYDEIGSQVWHIFKAPDKRSFAQRIRRFHEWAEKKIEKGPLLSKIRSLCNKRAMFSQYFDHPSAHRTSTMLDRLMRWQDKFLFNRQYFHGEYMSAESAIRAWAILYNFKPLCPRATGNENKYVSPAERLNGFRYRDNWLENLLVSTSMRGYRR